MKSKEAEPRPAHLANKQVHTSTNANIERAIEEQIQDMASNIEVLGQMDVECKPMGSGWKINSIDELAIDIFETKPLRGSSYIKTPETYSNSRCALINIKNEDEECS